MKRRFWTVLLSLVAVLCLTISLTACGCRKTECEKGNHEFETAWTLDATNHWHKCKKCDEITNKAAHVYDKEVVADEYRASEATYTEPAKYYKSCVCGAKGTETFNNGSTLSAQDNQVNLKSGVTLGKTYICDEQHPVILESMEFPEPVIELAIEPKTKAGQGKLGESLAKLAEEDPTFRAHTNQETGQTIIAGMGELHLEIIVDRLLREFKVEANVGAPQVAYKETITKPADIDSKYAKQSGGRGQYGHCKVKFEPMDANGEEIYKFESTVVGGAIPKEYIPAVGEGIEEAMKAGILGGFPVVGVHANVYDGSYHEVDSSEMAFHIAGSLAFKEAMQKGAPVLLEPIMKVEVSTPEDYMGDVIGDINSRRGRIEGMDDIGGGKMIRGFVPLAEMFGYATDLRSKTQGRGNYSMFFDKYEQVPKNVQEKVLSAKAK